jgi:hypothetical protein
VGVLVLSSRVCMHRLIQIACMLPAYLPPACFLLTCLLSLAILFSADHGWKVSE